MLTPEATEILGWVEVWRKVKDLRHTGPVIVDCAQGEPVDVKIPGPVTRIRLQRPSKRDRLTS